MEQFRVPAGLGNYRDALATSFPTELEAIDTYVGLLRDVRTVMSKASRVRNPKQAADILGPGYRTLRVMSATLGDVFDRIGASPRLRTVLAGIGDLRGGAEQGVLSGARGRLPALRRRGLVSARRRTTDRRRTVACHHRQRWTGPAANAGRRDSARGRRGCGRVRRPAADRRRGLPDTITAPIVVSNADLKRTFTELLPADAVPAKLRTRMRQATMAVPLHVEYLILDRDLAAEGAPNTNWWVYPMTTWTARTHKWAQASCRRAHSLTSRPPA